MAKSEITVTSHLDAHVFTRFSNFNAFRLHNRWLGLAGFPVLMLALAFVNRATGSLLLFRLFAVTGIALPVLYLLFYAVSLRRQVAANGLTAPRLAYTVTLSPRGVAVSNTTEHTSFRWEQVYRVYLLHDAAYVYITRARAFLLPAGDLPEGCTMQDVADLTAAHLAAVRLFDKRPRRERRSGGAA